MTVEEVNSLIKSWKESTQKAAQKAAQGKVTDLIGEENVYITICNSNCFLSFSQKESVADSFITERKKGCPNNFRLCKFIIEPIEDKESDFFVSNIVLGDASDYGEQEAEVLDSQGNHQNKENINRTSLQNALKQNKVKIVRYKSKPTVSIKPACSGPNMSPAPLISKSL